MIKNKMFSALSLIMCLSLTGCFGERPPIVQSANQPADNLPDIAAISEDNLPAEPEPDNGWDRDLPENHGMDSRVLDALHTALADAPIHAALTVKDGVIVDEYFQDGYNEASVFALQSCTKSFTSALIGIAIDQGYIESVDVPIAEFFPELESRNNPYWRQMTLRHLLTHSSGINDADFGSWYRSENWVTFTLDQELAGAPGSVFIYSTGGSHLMSAIIQQATGMTEYEFGRQNLFEPLDMDSVLWRTDPQGLTDGGNGIAMNVYDMAKFGQLYLNGGQWQGRQVISEEWVAESSSVQYAGTGRYSAYGYQWWIRQFGANGYDTFFAQGHFGQLIFVVPELNLVSVFTSYFPYDSGDPFPYFADYVMAACET
jgi:CubicO group peptidase (beta-lactamase class C family)